ncbi:unnamed protein product [Porites lobata]|uniref:Flavoprotein domain-containing protein n=1 Tax=Porites lobata TaxID=104759 RepID=A0ABN8N4H6_9CNID|nr:unnamed protein product [Porites lobata]
MFKVLLLGDAGVGKTSLMWRFSEDVFNKTYISTIGIDFKLRTIEVEGKRVRLQIWDTAGQERFHAISVSYYRSAIGIMLVYDITSRRSFENIAKWLRNIDEHAKEDVIKLLVGNKCDLRGPRAVKREEGEQLATEYDMSFFETSAKENESIEDAFVCMAQEIMEKFVPGWVKNDYNKPKKVEITDGTTRKSRKKETKCSAQRMTITFKMATETSTSATNQSKNVLIGVTGSVASIKLSKLVEELLLLPSKPNIQVIATDCSTHFFDESKIRAKVFRDKDEWEAWRTIQDPVLHIELRRWADLMVIAPLDANTMAKIANGLCDNLLTCTVRAWDMKKPLLFCPAMNTFMWEHPITSSHVEQLVNIGYTHVPPIRKTLACGDTGNNSIFF